MTDSLVARLREAIDETERIAQAATPGPWRWGDWSATFGTLEQDPYVLERAPGLGPFPAIRQRDDESDEVLRTEVDDFGEANRTFIAHNDPTRVLRRCAADRKILDLHKADSNGRCQQCAQVDWDGEWKGERSPCLTVLALAEAYGVEA